MDAVQFLARRRADPRFTNERAVAPFEVPNMSSWYSQGTRETDQPGLKRTVHQAAVKKEPDPNLYDRKRNNIFEKKN